MAVTKAKKIEQVEKMGADFKKVKSAIVGSFAKLTVAQDFELRKSVRSVGGRYRVVKNTLAARAAKGTAIEESLKKLKGVTSVATTEGDPVALAKALTKIAKDVPSFQFKSGVVEGRVIGIAEIEQLANLPSKEELISKLMFLLNAPAQRIASALNGLPRNLAVTVNEAIKANKFGS